MIHPFGLMFIVFGVLVTRNGIIIWKTLNALTDAKLNGHLQLIKELEKKLNKLVLMIFIYFASFAILSIGLSLIIGQFR